MGIYERDIAKSNSNFIPIKNSVTYYWPDKNMYVVGSEIIISSRNNKRDDKVYITSIVKGP